jgi:uncharacterized membrane-anchored protein
MATIRVPESFRFIGEEGSRRLLTEAWGNPPAAAEGVLGMLVSDGQHTLNYNIRILGRRGVLVLNAVAGMNQLAAIRNETGNILPAVEFNEGHPYNAFVKRLFGRSSRPAEADAVS